jgi:hypothetical protein
VNPSASEIDHEERVVRDQPSRGPDLAGEKSAPAIALQWARRNVRQEVGGSGAGGIPLALNSRRVHVSGCTATPDAAWVTQQARNLGLQRPELDGGHRFLVRDRDSKFPLAFEVFRSAANKVIRTPVKAPRANAYAEWWVRTVRTECLDWLLMLNQRHLEAVLRVYVHHYNAEGSSCPRLRDLASRWPPRCKRTCVGATSWAVCCTNITRPRHEPGFVHPSGVSDQDR